MTRRFWLFALPVLTIAVIGGGAVWTLLANGHPPGDPDDIEQVAFGKAIYGRDCARCHGDDLGGEFGWLKEEVELSDEEVERMMKSLGDVAPAHDSSGATRRHDDETLFSIIKDGPEVALAKINSRMPAFHDRLQDEEIWSIVAFLKSHWQDDLGAPE